MRQADVPMDRSVFHELIIRHAMRKEFELCLQRMDDMAAWDLGASLEIVEAVASLAAQHGNSRLAFEMVSNFEVNSPRRVGIQVWVNMLIASAESLFVSFRFP